MSERSIPIVSAKPAVVDAVPPLTAAQRATLRAAAALVIHASAEHGVPGADDEIIATDIERTMGRDRADVLRALEELDTAAGAPLAECSAAQRQVAGRWLREHRSALATTFANLVLVCYYRDDRVMRSLGLEPRPPYPKGYEVEPGDWSLLDPGARTRPHLAIVVKKAIEKKSLLLENIYLRRSCRRSTGSIILWGKVRRCTRSTGSLPRWPIPIVRS